ncbi:testis-specific Y-encoded protein 1-like isoform X1 [Ictidomys tridecemlineatus]
MARQGELEESQDQHSREHEGEEDTQVQLVQRRLPKAGRRPPRLRSKMDKLQILQLELSFVNARASRACARLKRKVEMRCKSHLDRRRAIIQRIPGFWAKVMMYHPQVSVILSWADKDLLSYLRNLEAWQVEELRYPKSLYRIKFSFQENPYFQNEVVMKEYQLNITGYEASCSSVLQWLVDGEALVHSPLQDSSRLTFFSWLSGHKCADSNRIAEVIIEDLWVNPLDYYQEEDSTRAEDAGLARNLGLLHDQTQSPCLGTCQQGP